MPEPIESNENKEDLKVNQYVSNKMVFGTLKLTEELKKDALNALMGRFYSVQQKRKDKVEEYDCQERLYMGRTTGDKQTLAQVMTSDGFNAVEDWVALTQDTMFPIDLPFDIKGQKQEIAGDQLDRIKRVLNKNRKRTGYKNGQAIDFEMEHEKVAAQGFKHGTFVAKAVWKVDDEPAMYVVEQDKIVEGEVLKDSNGQAYKETVIKEKIEVEDYAGYEFVDLRKLSFRSDKLTWMIEEIDTSWAKIEAANDKGVRLYDNLEKARKTRHPDNAEDSNKEQLEDAGAEVEDINIYSLDKDIRLLEGHHIPLKIKLKNGKKETVLCIIVVANKKEVIRVQPTPYRELPYLFNQFFLQAGVEGLGLIEKIEKDLKEINTRRTLALDANTRGLYGMKAVNMKYIKKPKQLRVRKDGLIELKNTDKPIDQIIQFFRPPTEYANISDSIINKIAEGIVRTTRMKGILAGEKVTPQPSASEWAGMMKEALKSVKLILKRIAKGQIEEWLRRAYIMNVFNRQKPWSIPIERKEQVEIRRTPKEEQLLIAQQLATGVPFGETNLPKPEMRTEVVSDWEEVLPEQIYTDGIDIDVIGIAYMEDTVVTRHQEMQKIDLSAKYQNLEMINDAGQRVTFNFYKMFNKFFTSFGDDSPEDQFMPLPPAPPPQIPVGAPGQGLSPQGPPGGLSGGAQAPIAPQGGPMGQMTANPSDIINAAMGGAMPSG